MAKFTTWFKEKSTKLNNSDMETTGLPPGNHNEESTRQSPPPSALAKETQLLGQMKHPSSSETSKPPSSDKPIYTRSLFWASLGVSGGLIAFGYATIWSIDRSLPDKAALNSIVREQTLTIKAADDTILQQQGPATRVPLKLDQIPDTLEKAFIASEDRRFTQHNGVDYKGIFRAVASNLRSKNVVEGGSTITQQVSRILFLSQERTVWRKLKEVRLAQAMEKELTKDQILERYLNLVYLGSGAYGVADAASVYFSKPVDQLSLGEMATIAGLAPAPSLYSPVINPQAAKQRRNLVLQRMQEDGVITADQKQAAIAEPITINSSSPQRLQVQSPYFTSYITKELPKYVSPQQLKEGGLTVETSLNPTLQKAAEEAVTKTLKNQGRWENFQQAALVAVDPKNGEIQAMVGGKDFGKNQFNRVTQAQRQPGSTFKGFLYAAAIASGISPYKNYIDAPFIVDGYEPKNYNKKSFRGTMDMRDALTRSVNTIAVKVLMDVGFEPTIQLAHNMGIKSNIQPTYSLALGSWEVNLLELTSAYGTLATQGLHTEAHGIRRILNRQGQVIWSADYKPQRALDADSAAITTWMLRSVVQEGTGNAAALNRPVAGKTGTSDDSRDLWFVGYIPQMVTGVWLGNDDNNPTSGRSSSAAATWHEFMKTAVEGMPIEKFPQRPKLEGRKGTITAQAIKPKRIINNPPPSDDEKSNQQVSSEDGSRSRRRRRARRYYQEQQENQTPRRGRRHRQQQVEQADRPARERPYLARQSEELSGSRRQREPLLPLSPRRSAPESSKTSPSLSPPSRQPSWRERLQPLRSSSEKNSQG